MDNELYNLVMEGYDTFSMFYYFSGEFLKDASSENSEPEKLFEKMATTIPLALDNG